METLSDRLTRLMDRAMAPATLSEDARAERATLYARTLKDLAGQSPAEQYEWLDAPAIMIGRHIHFRLGSRPGTCDAAAFLEAEKSVVAWWKSVCPEDQDTSKGMAGLICPDHLRNGSRDF